MKINKFNIKHKLLLLSAAYMLPIIVLAYFALSGIEMPLDFARQEKLGNRYQRPLEMLIKLIPEHALLLKQHMNGSEGLEPAINQKESEIDQTLKGLKETDNQIGAQLQFTDEALKKAGREQARASRVQEKWQRLVASVSKITLQEVDALHSEIISDVQAMVAHAGDKSNLILDPDLDSYYVMDLTLLALPQTQVRIGQILSYGNDLLIQGDTSMEEKISLAVHSTMLRDADISRINTSSVTALKEDINFYGSNDSMQSSMPDLVKNYSASAEEFAQLVEKMSKGEKVDIQAFNKAGLKAREDSFKLWDESVQQLDSLLDKRIDHFNNVKMWTILPSFIAVLMAWALAWYITRSITRPFQGLTARIRDTCGQLGDGAKQMSSSSQALAQRATEQAASLQETAASLNEISSVSKHNTDNSQQGCHLSESTKTSAQQGVEQMISMTEAIHTIKKSADETAHIVKIIDEIAFQTNLLALNAAVEAARAGDAGKGFAVVAEEVRNLAQRSANAAKESAEKIRLSKDLAENGVKITELVAKSLESISQGAIKSSDLMKEIAAAGKEQTTGIEQINIAVAELDKVTQLNSAAAEESSAASEELTAQAVTLEEIVQDLSILVFGAKTSHQVASQPERELKAVAHASKSVPIVRTYRAEPMLSFSENGNGHKAALKPTQIIPLDDRDYQDF